MRRTLARVVTCALVARVALVSPEVCAAPAATAATAGVEREARLRFERGIVLFDGRDFGGALAEFRRADAILPSPIVKHDIALCYEALGRPVAARAALDDLLAMSGVPAAQQTRARKLRAQLEERIGKLRIAVDVAGARVEVDGLEVGTTPLAAPVDVAAGARLVTVQAPGYLPSRREATVAGGDVASLAFTLQPTAAKLAQLAVRTTPPNAQVTVDAEAVGQTPFAAPLTLTPGIHDIAATRAGYAPAKTIVRLGDGASGSVDLTLEEQPGGVRGTLVLTASEPSPVVFIDGRARPEGQLVLPPGLHRLRVEHTGFLVDEREVDVREGATARLRINLLPTAETRSEHDRAVRTRRTLAWAVGIGGGVLAAASGTWWALSRADARSASRDLDRALRESEPGSSLPCDPKGGGTTTAVCQAELTLAADRDSAARTRTILAVTGFGVGVAAVAVAVVLRLTGPDPKRFARVAIGARGVGFDF